MKKLLPIVFTLLAACGGEEVRLDTAPIVSISASPTAGVEPLPVQFFSTVSGGNGDVFFEWDFGDGSAASEAPNPLHEYAESGDFDITLTVTDEDGDTGASDLRVAVGTDEMPSAAASADPIAGSAPLQVSFDCAVGGGNDPVEVRWSFGEGSTSELGAVSHTYTAPGDYVARCIAEDAQGDSASDTVSITVGPPPDAGSR